MPRIPCILPGSVPSAAVDVCPVLHQVAHNREPASSAGLTQGAMAGIVSVVEVAEPPLQTVQHRLLVTGKTDSQ